MNVGMIHSVFEKEMDLLKQCVSYLVCKKKETFFKVQKQRKIESYMFFVYRNCHI